MSEYEKYLGEVDAETNKHKTESIKNALDGLKKEWGGAYKHKLSFAHNVLREHGSDELGKLLHENPEFGDNPALIKLLNKVGEVLYKEDNIPEGENLNGRLTPDEAHKKALAIMADAKHPYNIGDHLNHKAALKEVADLMAIAFPEEKG